MLVGKLTQEGKIEPSEAVHGVGAARRADRLARQAHVVGLRVVAGELQREVGFDAAADFHLATGVHGPATGRKLLFDDVRGTFAGDPRLLLPEPGEEQDVFTLEDRVAFELGAPVAVGVLTRQQPVAGEANGISHAGCEGANVFAGRRAQLCRVEVRPGGWLVVAQVHDKRKLESRSGSPRGLDTPLQGVPPIGACHPVVTRCLYGKRSLVARSMAKLAKLKVL